MLTSKQAESLLSQEKEEWISLACNNGGAFIERAVVILSQDINYQKLGFNWEVGWGMLHSALARKDILAVRRFINDWSCRSNRPSKVVTKFIPGEHYHCNGCKFNCLTEAKEYLEQSGFTYEGLRETHVYPTNGD